MFKTFADWFQTSSKSTKVMDGFSHELAELVTALMVEAAAADGQIGDSEMQLIASCVSGQFNLADEEVEQILEDALFEADKRIELHSLISRLRDKSVYEERIGVMEMVWMVVLADGRLDKIEGIGPILKRRLINKYGSTKAIGIKNVKELMQVKGISKKVATAIYEAKL